MFTTNSIVLSEAITSIFSSLSSTLGQVFSDRLNTIIKKLFANNEQGFAYDPNDLSTLYQDAAGTIPVTAAGQPVGLMKDKSGRNNHAYQTDSACKPKLQRNATTGAYYLAFDGADDFLQTNNIDFTATDKVSVFAGVRKLSDANTGIVVELSANANINNGAFYLATAINAPASEQWFASRGTSTAATTLGTNAAAYSAVYTAKASILPSSINTRRNGISMGTSVGSQGIGSRGSYPLYIGRRAGTTLPFNGHIYSLIGIGRLTTDAETIALEKSIAKNTEVTL